MSINSLSGDLLPLIANCGMKGCDLEQLFSYASRSVIASNSIIDATFPQYFTLQPRTLHITNTVDFINYAYDTSNYQPYSSISSRILDHREALYQYGLTDSLVSDYLYNDYNGHFDFDENDEFNIGYDVPSAEDITSIPSFHEHFLQPAYDSTISPLLAATLLFELLKNRFVSFQIRVETGTNPRAVRSSQRVLSLEETFVLIRQVRYSMPTPYNLQCISVCLHSIHTAISVGLSSNILLHAGPISEQRLATLLLIGTNVISSSHKNSSFPAYKSSVFASSQYPSIFPLSHVSNECPADPFVGSSQQHLIDSTSLSSPNLSIVLKYLESVGILVRCVPDGGLVRLWNVSNLTHYMGVNSVYFPVLSQRLPVQYSLLSSSVGKVAKTKPRNMIPTSSGVPPVPVDVIVDVVFPSINNLLTRPNHNDNMSGFGLESPPSSVSEQPSIAVVELTSGSGKVSLPSLTETSSHSTGLHTLAIHYTHLANISRNIHVVAMSHSLSPDESNSPIVYTDCDEITVLKYPKEFFNTITYSNTYISDSDQSSESLCYPLQSISNHCFYIEINADTSLTPHSPGMRSDSTHYSAQLYMQISRPEHTPSALSSYLRPSTSCWNNVIQPSVSTSHSLTHHNRSSGLSYFSFTQSLSRTNTNIICKYSSLSAPEYLLSLYDVSSSRPSSLQLKNAYYRSGKTHLNSTSPFPLLCFSYYPLNSLTDLSSLSHLHNRYSLPLTHVLSSSLMTFPDPNTSISFHPSSPLFTSTPTSHTSSTSPSHSVSFQTRAPDNPGICLPPAPFTTFSTDLIVDILILRIIKAASRKGASILDFVRCLPTYRRRRLASLSSEITNQKWCVSIGQREIKQIVNRYFHIYLTHNPDENGSDYYPDSISTITHPNTTYFTSVSDMWTGLRQNTVNTRNSSISPIIMANRLRLDLHRLISGAIVNSNMSDSSNVTSNDSLTSFSRPTLRNILTTLPLLNELALPSLPQLSSSRRLPSFFSPSVTPNPSGNNKKRYHLRSQSHRRMTTSSQRRSNHTSSRRKKSDPNKKLSFDEFDSETGQSDSFDSSSDSDSNLSNYDVSEDDHRFHTQSLKTSLSSRRTTPRRVSQRIIQNYKEIDHYDSDLSSEEVLESHLDDIRSVNEPGSTLKTPKSSKRSNSKKLPFNQVKRGSSSKKETKMSGLLGLLDSVEMAIAANNEDLDESEDDTFVPLPDFHELESDFTPMKKSLPTPPSNLQKKDSAKLLTPSSPVDKCDSLNALPESDQDLVPTVEQTSIPDDLSSSLPIPDDLPSPLSSSLPPDRLLAVTRSARKSVSNKIAHSHKKPHDSGEASSKHIVQKKKPLTLNSSAIGKRKRSLLDHSNSLPVSQTSTCVCSCSHSLDPIFHFPTPESISLSPSYSLNPFETIESDSVPLPPMSNGNFMVFSINTDAKIKVETEVTVSIGALQLSQEAINLVSKSNTNVEHVLPVIKSETTDEHGIVQEETFGTKVELQSSRTIPDLSIPDSSSIPNLEITNEIRLRINGFVCRGFIRAMLLHKHILSLYNTLMKSVPMHSTCHCDYIPPLSFSLIVSTMPLQLYLQIVGIGTAFLPTVTEDSSLRTIPLWRQPHQHQLLLASPLQVRRCISYVSNAISCLQKLKLLRSLCVPLSHIYTGGWVCDLQNSNYSEDFLGADEMTKHYGCPYTNDCDSTLLSAVRFHSTHSLLNQSFTQYCYFEGMAIKNKTKRLSKRMKDFYIKASLFVPNQRVVYDGIMFDTTLWNVPPNSIKYNNPPTHHAPPEPIGTHVTSLAGVFSEDLLKAANDGFTTIIKDCSMADGVTNPDTKPGIGAMILPQTCVHCHQDCSGRHICTVVDLGLAVSNNHEVQQKERFARGRAGAEFMTQLQQSTSTSGYIWGHDSLGDSKDVVHRLTQTQFTQTESTSSKTSHSALDQATRLTQMCHSDKLKTILALIGDNPEHLSNNNTSEIVQSALSPAYVHNHVSGIALDPFIDWQQVMYYCGTKNSYLTDTIVADVIKRPTSEVDSISNNSISNSLEVVSVSMECGGSRLPVCVDVWQHIMTSLGDKRYQDARKIWTQFAQSQKDNEQSDMDTVYEDYMADELGTELGPDDEVGDDNTEDDGEEMVMSVDKILKFDDLIDQRWRLHCCSIFETNIWHTTLKHHSSLHSHISVLNSSKKPNLTMEITQDAVRSIKNTLRLLMSAVQFVFDPRYHPLHRSTEKLSQRMLQVLEDIYDIPSNPSLTSSLISYHQLHSDTSHSPYIMVSAHQDQSIATPFLSTVGFATTFIFLKFLECISALSPKLHLLTSPLLQALASVSPYFMHVRASPPPRGPSLPSHDSSMHIPMVLSGLSVDSVYNANFISAFITFHNTIVETAHVQIAQGLFHSFIPLSADVSPVASVLERLSVTLADQSVELAKAMKLDNNSSLNNETPTSVDNEVLESTRKLLNSLMTVSNPIVNSSLKTTTLPDQAIYACPHFGESKLSTTTTLINSFVVTRMPSLSPTVDSLRKQLPTIVDSLNNRSKTIVQREKDITVLSTTMQVAETVNTREQEEYPYYGVDQEAVENMQATYNFHEAVLDHLITTNNITPVEAQKELHNLIRSSSGDLLLALQQGRPVTQMRFATTSHVSTSFIPETVSSIITDDALTTVTPLVFRSQASIANIISTSESSIPDPAQSVNTAPIKMINISSSIPSLSSSLNRLKYHASNNVLSNQLSTQQTISVLSNENIVQVADMIAAIFDPAPISSAMFDFITHINNRYMMDYRQVSPHQFTQHSEYSSAGLPISSTLAQHGFGYSMRATHPLQLAHPIFYGTPHPPTTNPNMKQRRYFLTPMYLTPRYSPIHEVGMTLLFPAFKSLRMHLYKVICQQSLLDSCNINAASSRHTPVSIFPRVQVTTESLIKSEKRRHQSTQVSKPPAAEYFLESVTSLIKYNLDKPAFSTADTHRPWVDGCCEVGSSVLVYDGGRMVPSVTHHPISECFNSSSANPVNPSPSHSTNATRNPRDSIDSKLDFKNRHSILSSVVACLHSFATVGLPTAVALHRPITVDTYSLSSSHSDHLFDKIMFASPVFAANIEVVLLVLLSLMNTEKRFHNYLYIVDKLIKARQPITHSGVISYIEQVKPSLSSMFRGDKRPLSYFLSALWEVLCAYPQHNSTKLKEQLIRSFLPSLISTTISSMAVLGSLRRVQYDAPVCLLPPLVSPSLSSTLSTSPSQFTNNPSPVDPSSELRSAPTPNSDNPTQLLNTDPLAYQEPVVLEEWFEVVRDIVRNDDNIFLNCVANLINKQTLIPIHFDVESSGCGTDLITNTTDIVQEANVKFTNLASVANHVKPYQSDPVSLGLLSWQNKTPLINQYTNSWFTSGVCKGNKVLMVCNAVLLFIKTSLSEESVSNSSYIVNKSVVVEYVCQQVSSQIQIAHNCVLEIIIALSMVNMLAISKCPSTSNTSLQPSQAISNSSDRNLSLRERRFPFVFDSNDLTMYDLTDVLEDMKTSLIAVRINDFNLVQAFIDNI